MPTPSEQLLSRTIYDVDGTTTVWNFSFTGGYLDPSHVKAYTELPTGVRTPIAVTPEMLIGEFQLQIAPALPSSAGVLVIYRDTPKDLPLVDFVEGPLSEIALDTNAKQAVFIAAEAQDTINTSNLQAAIDAQVAAQVAAEQANIDANTAASAASAAGSSALIASNAAAAVSGPAGSSLVGYTPAGAGAAVTDVQSKLRESVSVKDFGAVGDGVTDDRNAIQAAIDAVNLAGGGTVYFPPGTYYKPATSDAITPKSNVTLRGAGMGATILKHDDTTGTSRYIGSVSIGNACENFAVEDMTWAGMWAIGNNSLGRQFAELWYITNLRIENVESVNQRAMGMTGRFCNGVTIRGCYVHRTNGDGIAFWDCADIDVSWNRLEDCNDDCISLHTNDTTATPLRNRIVVIGNMVSTSQGIKVLGAKNCIVAYNVMSRIYSYGVYITPDVFFNQGNTPHHSIQIIGNTINDVFLRVQGGNAEQYYMRVGGGQQNKGVLAAAPGQNDTATGAIVSLFGTNAGYFQAQNTDDTTIPSPGGRFVHVVGNTLARTLPAVSAIADWGFGTLFSADEGTGEYTGAVTEAALNTNGLIVEPYLKHVLIEANTIATTGDKAIWFNVGGTPANLLFSDFTIRGNKIVDFISYGIFWPGGAVSVQDIRVHGNDFDADPRFVSNNRGASGTWLANSLPSAVYTAVVSGFDVRRNQFRNTCNAVTAGGGISNNVLDNVLRCDPSNIGFNVANKGIGVVARSGMQYHYVIEDSDPTSVNYGRVLNATLWDSNTMPTAGKYVSGHVVRNVNASIGGAGGSQYLVSGWYRTSLGSGHVLNTDWREMRSLTGT